MKFEEEKEKAGSNAEPKQQCNDCGVCKPPSDFLKVDVDTGVISEVGQCMVCREKAKKRRVVSRMKKVQKKMRKLSQAPALCPGPGLPWLNRCPFLPGLQEVHRLMNEDGLSEEERNLRMRAFSAVIDNEHNGTRHLKTLDKSGRTVGVSSIQDPEEEDRQMEISELTCSNCHRMITNWFGENTRVARADGSNGGSDDGSDYESDDESSSEEFD